MSYYFTLTYPQNRPACTIRELLEQLLVPRKWQHELRINHNILVNGQYRYFNQLVYPQEQVTLFLDCVETAQRHYQPSGLQPDVIYEDANLLVINKPARQKTHPNLSETNTALNDCATYLQQTPFIVHRLDMLTSGLLLVAKNPAVVPLLNRELTTKICQREYVAVVESAQKLPAKGTITFPIGQDPIDQRKRMVRADGLKATTHYQVLTRKPTGTALLQIQLETGRTHQIRVHLAAIGCPIIGDPLYNPNIQSNEFLHLTAYQMSLIKPFSFDQLQVTLPVDKNPVLGY